jgi:hypothetical protein
VSRSPAGEAEGRTELMGKERLVYGIDRQNFDGRFELPAHAAA